MPNAPKHIGSGPERIADAQPLPELVPPGRGRRERRACGREEVLGLGRTESDWDRLGLRNVQNPCLSEMVLKSVMALPEVTLAFLSFPKAILAYPNTMVGSISCFFLVTQLSVRRSRNLDRPRYLHRVL